MIGLIQFLLTQFYWVAVNLCDGRPPLSWYRKVLLDDGLHNFRFCIADWGFNSRVHSVSGSWRQRYSSGYFTYLCLSSTDQGNDVPVCSYRFVAYVRQNSCLSVWVGVEPHAKFSTTPGILQWFRCVGLCCWSLTM